MPLNGSSVLHAQPGRSYLGLALCLSLGLHIGVLYWLGRIPSPPATTPLEVLLVNAWTVEAPKRPGVVAQQHLDAGSETPQTHQEASVLPSMAMQSLDAQVLMALQKRQADLQALQQELLTQVHKQLAIRSPEPAPQGVQQAEHDALAQDHPALSAQIAALEARIAQTQTQHNRAGLAAVRAAYAAYVEDWRLRIEALGTEHYPEQARGRVHGRLQLTVTIDRKGQLLRVQINRPSKHAILNQAAQRIVRLAAPFAPLPEEIARRTETLDITRTWDFTDQHVRMTP